MVSMVTIRELDGVHGYRKRVRWWPCMVTIRELDVCGQRVAMGKTDED